MIYLDNAAGSFPKPPQVGKAMAEALDEYGANPCLLYTSRCV